MLAGRRRPGRRCTSSRDDRVPGDERLRPIVGADQVCGVARHPAGARTPGRHRDCGVAGHHPHGGRSIRRARRAPGTPWLEADSRVAAAVRQRRQAGRQVDRRGGLEDDLGIGRRVEVTRSGRRNGRRHWRRIDRTTGVPDCWACSKSDRAAQAVEPLGHDQLAADAAQASRPGRAARPRQARTPAGRRAGWWRSGTCVVSCSCRV